MRLSSNNLPHFPLYCSPSWAIIYRTSLFTAHLLSNSSPQSILENKKKRAFNDEGVEVIRATTTLPGGKNLYRKRRECRFVRSNFWDYFGRNPTWPLLEEGFCKSIFPATLTYSALSTWTFWKCNHRIFLNTNIRWRRLEFIDFNCTGKMIIRG